MANGDSDLKVVSSQPLPSDELRVVSSQPLPTAWDKFTKWGGDVTGIASAAQNIRALPSQLSNVPAAVQQNVQQGWQQNPQELYKQWQTQGKPVAAQPVSALASGATIGGAGAQAAAQYLPSATKAALAESGGIIGAAREAIGNAPVDVTAAMEPVLKAKELVAGGGQLPSVFTKFLDRFGLGETPTATPPSPLTFAEGRAFAKNAGRLSADEASKMVPEMKAYVAEFANKIQDANKITAAANGQSGFAQALEDYHNAKNMQETMQVVREWGVDTILKALKLGIAGTIGGGAAGAGYDLYRSLKK